MLKTLNKLYSFLEYAVQDTTRALNDFKAYFEINPYAALDSDNVHQAVARLQVATELRHVVDLEVDVYIKGGVAEGTETEQDKARIEEFLTAFEKDLLKYVMRGAAHPSRSTSQSCNLLSQHKTAAYAEVLDLLQRLL